MNGRLEKEISTYNKIEAKIQNMPKILNEYYMSQRANRKSYTTLNVYINNIIHFIKFLGKDGVNEEFYKNINISTIEAYMISLETRQTKDGVKKIGDDALQQRWSSLNNFFDFLVKRKYIDSNPVIAVARPKNQTEHKVTYLSKVEINKLFRAIDRNPDMVMSMRDKTVVSVALATALRVSALVNINIEDIDFDNNVINVIEKRQKVRTIPIGSNTVELLQRWIDIRNEAFSDVDSSALFLSQKRSRLSGDTVGDILTKYCEEAGIKRITPHKLRASAACALAKAGMPVKAIAKQLGHSNSQVTMRYIAVFEEDEEKTKNILDGLI